MSFENKTAVVTGASQGIGLAVARKLASQGANIAIIYVGNQETGENAKKEIEQLGVKVGLYYCDVSDFEASKACVDQIIEEFGGIDILFSNAGIAAYGYSWELTEEQWDTLIEVNLKGGFLVSKYVIPHLIEKKSGVIIYNSSVGGLRGFGRMSHYAASKHGLVGLTKSQAIELAPYGIRVVSLHPTGVNTPMNDGLAELEGTTPVEIAERSPALIS